MNIENLLFKHYQILLWVGDMHKNGAYWYYSYTINGDNKYMDYFNKLKNTWCNFTHGRLKIHFPFTGDDQICFLNNLLKMNNFTY